MPSHDPFAPQSTARRVHVQRPPADEPTPSAVVGAGFIDPESTPDPVHDDYDVVEPAAEVPRGTPDVAEDGPSGDGEISDQDFAGVERPRDAGGG